MIALGIDPGTTRIGFGIVERQGQQLSRITSGIFQHPHIPIRFEEELLSLVTTHHPEIAVVEKLFFTKNQKTALSVAEMRGVIKFILQKAGVPILELTPLQIKQGVTGYGNASKEQVSILALKILHYNQKPQYDDESDALAAAISGAYFKPLKPAKG